MSGTMQVQKSFLEPSGRVPSGHFGERAGLISYARTIQFAQLSAAGSRPRHLPGQAIGRVFGGCPKWYVRPSGLGIPRSRGGVRASDSSGKAAPRATRCMGRTMLSPGEWRGGGWGGEGSQSRWPARRARSPWRHAMFIEVFSSKILYATKHDHQRPRPQHRERGAGNQHRHALFVSFCVCM